MPKPLLLLDIDGPLNPYAAKLTLRPPGYETYLLPVTRPGPSAPAYYGMSVPRRRSTKPIWLNPHHGAMLLAMTDLFDLHWATGRDDANTNIAPLVGLPPLPEIHWSDYAPLDSTLTVLPAYEETRKAKLGGARRTVETVHWKTRPIARYTALLDAGTDPAAHGGRPFAWIDDEITDADRHHLALVGSVGTHLLHHINPAVGLTTADLDTIRKWAITL